MVKILLNLDNLRAKLLEDLARVEQNTKTDLLKEGLDLLFKSRKYPTGKSLIEYFGAWSHQDEDGLEYQNKLRNNWGTV